MTVADITAEDPFVEISRDFLQDPYRHYDRLRAKGNLVFSSAGEKRWITASYDTAAAIFNDQRFSVEVPEEQLEAFSELRHNLAYNDLLTGFTKFMLAQDPPQHTRVRKLANKAFTRSEVTGMSERIANIVDALIDRVAATGKMDLIADFAFPLPITIICEVLGIPAADHNRLRDWTACIAPIVEPILNLKEAEAGAKATTELFDYLKVLIADRKRQPTEDLLSAFVQAEEEGDRLSLDELLANMLLLIVAGHETTVNLIGNGMLALIRDPETMQRLRQQPELIPMAVEEFLRYQSPLQTTDRFILHDFDFEGQELKKGERVSVVIGGANRDPSRFENPDCFDIDRLPNKHLAFGQGIHFCLGAPLARFEAKMAFERLLARLSDIRLDCDQVEYRKSASFRGLQSLPLAFRAE